MPVGSLDEEFSNKRRNVTLREGKKDIRGERSLATQLKSQANKTKSATVTFQQEYGQWWNLRFCDVYRAFRPGPHHHDPFSSHNAISPEAALEKHWLANLTIWID